MKQTSWGVTVGLKRPRRQPGGTIPRMELCHHNTIRKGAGGQDHKSSGHLGQLRGALVAECPASGQGRSWDDSLGQQATTRAESNAPLSPGAHTVLPYNMRHAAMAAPRDERANSLVLNQRLGGNTSGPRCNRNRSIHGSETCSFVRSPSGPPLGGGDLVAGLPGR